MASQAMPSRGAVENFTSINFAPWSSFGSLVIAALVIYALSTTGGWRDPAAGTP